jgi:hypothetical protein
MVLLQGQVIRKEIKVALQKSPPPLGGESVSALASCRMRTV